MKKQLMLQSLLSTGQGFVKINLYKILEIEREWVKKGVVTPKKMGLDSEEEDDDEEEADTKRTPRENRTPLGEQIPISTPPLLIASSSKIPAASSHEPCLSQLEASMVELKEEQKKMIAKALLSDISSPSNSSASTGASAPSSEAPTADDHPPVADPPLTSSTPDVAASTLASPDGTAMLSNP
ncbi:hypothetical protein CJ030_MR3G002921 [Morella rubra]|uniref:Uncharacterized protein n=1 Tax=Morella rubra TaxID=262757 RepID=A0A6A1WCY8_9ROSI|nr:hypothetical protein CJ030_MR3G002921 [Morella rubra]